MKKSISKISMKVIAAMAFLAVLTLNIQQNENGDWKVSPRTALAQGGSESGSGSEGSENGDDGGTTECETCISGMMLKWVNCHKYWAIYNSDGTTIIRTGVVNGNKFACRTKKKAFCNQLLQLPCDAEIPDGAIVIN